MFNKILLTLFLFGLCQSISFGQNTFYDGYIVMAEGDTTYGMIRYRAIKSEGEYLDFKKTRKDEPIKISKNEVTSFSYSNGRLFKPVNLQSVAEYESTIIVEVLVEGGLSLYKGHHGYILRRASMTSHLLFANSPKNTLTAGLLQNVNTRNAGLFFSEGCSKPIFGELGYRNSDRSLINLTKAFNECQETPYQLYGSNAPVASFKYGLVVGLSSSSLIFKDDNTGSFSDINRAEFDRSNTAVIGVELITTLERMNKNFSIITGLFFQQSNHFGDFRRVRTPNDAIEEEYFFEANVIKPVLGFSYQIANGQTPLTISGGLIHNFRLETKSTITRFRIRTDQNTGQNQITTTAIMDEWMKNRSSPGHWLGLGTSLNLSEKFDLGLQFRYENTGRINGLASRTTNLQLMVSLMFKK